MSKDKNHRLGLIGLCLTTACALMAFSASAAQAVEKPAWMVHKTTIETGKLLTVDVTATFEALKFENGLEGEKLVTETKNVALLLGETALGSIWIGCEKAQGTNLDIQGGGIATGELNFTSCKTSMKQGVHMKLSEICKPVEPIKAGVKLSIILHEEEGIKFPYVRAEGTGAGGAFTTVVIPEGCAFEGSYKVKGALYLEEPDGGCETEKATHKFQEGALSTLEFGSYAATIDGVGLFSVKEGGASKEFSCLVD